MPTNQNVNPRVREVISRVFEVDASEFSPNTRRGELVRWDSLGHLTLIEALCSEFKIEVPPEDALAMESVDDITRIVGTLVDGASS